MSSNPEPFDVIETLRPVQRRLALGRLRLWLQRGIAAGGLAAGVSLVIAHVHPYGLALPVSVGLLLVGAAAGGLYGAKSWPNPLDAARAADRHFALDDRLTSALEFRDASDPLQVLQRADTATRVRGLRLSHSGRGRPAPRETAIATASIAAVVLLLISGVPQPTGVSARAATAQQRFQHASVSDVPAINQVARSGLTKAEQADPVLRKLDAQMALLRRKLAHSKDVGAALRAISAAQQRLLRDELSLHATDAKSIALLNRMLARYRNQPASPNKAAAAAAARSLATLAREVGRQSPSRNQQLAHQAQQLTGKIPDGQLRTALHQIASFLSHRDLARTRKALKHASKLLTASARSTALKTRLRQANSQLASLKNYVAGLKHTAPHTHGNNARRQGQRKNSNSNSKLQPTQRNGRQGLVPNKRRTSAKSQPSSFKSKSPDVSAKGKAITNQSQGVIAQEHVVGGHVSRQGETLPGKNRYRSVHFTGTQTKGPRTAQTVSGAPHRGPPASYRPVVARYARTTHAALDRSPLPSNLKSYVRHYFTVLSR